MAQSTSKLRDLLNPQHNAAPVIQHHHMFGGGRAYEPNEDDIKLVKACEQGDVKSAEIALSNIDANCIDFNVYHEGLWKRSSVMFCVENGHLETLKVLMSVNDYCIWNRRDFDGCTMLQISASNDDVEMAKYLMRFILNNDDDFIKVRDKWGETALMKAADNGSIDMIKMLLPYSQINAEDKQHNTALSYCLDGVERDKDKYMECILYLLENNANPNYWGKYNKKNILHYAVIERDIDLIKKCVEDYQSILCIGWIDKDGNTPMELAEIYGFFEIANYLNSFMKVDRIIEIPCCIL